MWDVHEEEVGDKWYRLAKEERYVKEFGTKGEVRLRFSWTLGWQGEVWYV